MDTFDWHTTAQFLEASARHIAAEARKTLGLEHDSVRNAIGDLYRRAKLAHDHHAALTAPKPAQTQPGPSVKTNVGDPNAKGTGGGKKKR